MQRRAPRARAPPAHAYQHISGNRSSTARTRRDPSIRSARCMPAIPKEGRVGGVRGGARGASQRSLDARSGGAALRLSPPPSTRRAAPLSRAAPRAGGGRERAVARPARRAAERAGRARIAPGTRRSRPCTSPRPPFGCRATGTPALRQTARGRASGRGGGEGVSATRNAGGDELGLLAIALEILVHLVRGACTPGVSPINHTNHAIYIFNIIFAGKIRSSTHKRTKRRVGHAPPVCPGAPASARAIGAEIC